METITRPLLFSQIFLILRIFFLLSSLTGHISLETLTCCFPIYEVLLLCGTPGLAPQPFFVRMCMSVHAIMCVSVRMSVCACNYLRECAPGCVCVQAVCSGHDRGYIIHSSVLPEMDSVSLVF